MNKLQQFKQAIKNPPPERLAKIEYRSHLYQSFGIIMVCFILISKGYWYIVFALIFGVGVSYSQGMTAFMKYNIIMSLKKPERIEEYQNDISPTRRRSKIIKLILGGWAVFGSSVFAVIGSVLIVNPTYNRFVLMFLYPIVMIIFYFLFYFFPTYWVANYYYQENLKQMKGGIENAESKNKNN